MLLFSNEHQPVRCEPVSGEPRASDLACRRWQVARSNRGIAHVPVRRSPSVPVAVFTGSDKAIPALRNIDCTQRSLGSRLAELYDAIQPLEEECFYINHAAVR